jgi:uncharacterized protein
MRTSPAFTTVTVCDGTALRHLFRAGVAWFEQNVQRINLLNVYPVPDGDTGTNMLHTMRAALQAADASDTTHAGEMAQHLATGALYGSRGNSGTSFSQFLRGFAHSLQGKATMDAQQMVESFREASRFAYRAFQEPVEGTILTVGREMAEEAEHALHETSYLARITERVLERGKKSVAHTPELLPILKKAGVVDAGGQGLVTFFEGIVKFLNGEKIEQVEKMQTTTVPRREILQAADSRGYGYDVQYILHKHTNGTALDFETIRRDIEAMGESGVIIGDSDVIKVHIHVHDPGMPLSYGVRWGYLTDLVVENMQVQSEEFTPMMDVSAGNIGNNREDAPPITLEPGQIGVVAVSPGDGLRRMFLNLGVAAVVSGGQTMNPSTEDILNAIKSLNTDKVIVLPNNKNIIRSAEQAGELAAGLTDSAGNPIHVRVIPSRTVPQGVSAMMMHNADGTLDYVANMMREAIADVMTGEITTATRDIELDGIDVHNGSVIGLVDGKLAASGGDLNTVIREVLNRMDAANRELITLYYGQEVTEQQANALVESLQEEYNGQEFDVISGGQPFYPYILSVE